jgi:hypothetical protein
VDRRRNCRRRGCGDRGRLRRCGDRRLGDRSGRRPQNPRARDADRQDRRTAREEVFDVIAAGYLARQPRDVAAKIRVLERGTDMVLAAHRTPVRGPLVATTVETVRFTRPERVDFRLVRGPVPHVVERFTLTATNTGTTLDYRGELGTDLWRIGQRWGDLVADQWERAVATSLEVIKAEAERRASLGARTRRT